MPTDFTPILSLAGGALIGTAAVLLMLTLGRVMGATGIVSGLLSPSERAERPWRLALVLGMVSAPLLIALVSGELPPIQVPSSWLALVIGGVLVGFGASWGSGCTSGHGVCGLARGSRRSLAATASFMLTAVVTVYVVRHVLGWM